MGRQAYLNRLALVGFNPPLRISTLSYLYSVRPSWMCVGLLDVHSFRSYCGNIG